MKDSDKRLQNENGQFVRFPVEGPVVAVSTHPPPRFPCVFSLVSLVCSAANMRESLNERFVIRWSMAFCQFSHVSETTLLLKLPPKLLKRSTRNGVLSLVCGRDFRVLGKRRGIRLLAVVQLPYSTTLE